MVAGPLQRAGESRVLVTRRHATVPGNTECRFICTTSAGAGGEQPPPRAGETTRRHLVLGAK